MSSTGVLAGVVLAHLVAIAGCYQPDVRDCTVHCSESTDCTGGQICRADGWCAMPDIKDCPEGDHEEPGSNGAMADATGVPSPDAPSLCEQGCSNGTCVNGVCVIDCSTPYTCPNDITCPANLPCRVVCGEHSCGHKVICGLATTCEVQCTGDYACADEIQCNTNRCTVTCSGIGACKRRTKCANACACDVSCSGAGSCLEISECPAMTCRIGNGCTSLLAGCNDC